MTQLPLFDEQITPLYHRADPDTSRQAAQEIVASGVLNRQEQSVHDALCRCHTPVTFGELAQRSGIDYHAVARRMSGLVAKGKAMAVGARRCAVRGRNATEWEAIR